MCYPPSQDVLTVKQWTNRIFLSTGEFYINKQGRFGLEILPLEFVVKVFLDFQRLVKENFLFFYQ